MQNKKSTETSTSSWLVEIIQVKFNSQSFSALSLNSMEFPLNSHGVLYRRTFPVSESSGNFSGPKSKFKIKTQSSQTSNPKTGLKLTCKAPKSLFFVSHKMHENFVPEKATIGRRLNLALTFCPYCCCIHF